MGSITTPTLSLDLQAATKAGLTPRQAAAVAWTAEGKTDPEIGQILSISRHTAKAHVLGAMAETDTHTRAQLVAWLFIQGVLTGRDSARMLIFCFVLGSTWSTAPAAELVAALDPDQQTTTQLARRPRRGYRSGRVTRIRQTA